MNSFDDLLLTLSLTLGPKLDIKMMTLAHFVVETSFSNEFHTVQTKLITIKLIAVKSITIEFDVNMIGE